MLQEVANIFPPMKYVNALQKKVMGAKSFAVKVVLNKFSKCIVPSALAIVLERIQTFFLYRAEGEMVTPQDLKRQMSLK